MIFFQRPEGSDSGQRKQALKSDWLGSNAAPIITVAQLLPLSKSQFPHGKTAFLSQSSKAVKPWEALRTLALELH